MSTSDPRSETLDLLARARGGDTGASDELLPVVYDELRRIAGHVFARERGGHTLQPTVLVHEAYLNVLGADVDWESRRHFLCVAARAMRQLLREHARGRDAEKRGGAFAQVTLVDVHESGAAPGPLGTEFDVEALDAALEKLSGLNERQARIVELRFFCELTIRETAEALEVSTGTVENDWRFARAWLQRELGGT
ncbi:MAG: sigma-70 family RNA polymerase sigma factor [Planctomycetota bacterium]